MYERAERVAASLAAMGDQLRDTILDVNASAEASLGRADTPLAKAVRAPSHHSSYNTSYMSHGMLHSAYILHSENI